MAAEEEFVDYQIFETSDPHDIDRQIDDCDDKPLRFSSESLEVLPKVNEQNPYSESLDIEENPIRQIVFLETSEETLAIEKVIEKVFSSEPELLKQLDKQIILTVVKELSEQFGQSEFCIVKQAIQILDQVIEAINQGQSLVLLTKNDKGDDIFIPIKL